MADGQVKIQSVPGGDKTIDNTELLVGGATVERQRVQLGGAGAGELADVRTAAPAGTDAGVVTRNIPSGTQAISTAAGAQVDGHSATLGTTADSAATNTLIGRLQQLLSRWPAALVGGRLDVNLGAAPATVTTDVADRAARLVGHVTVDGNPAENLAQVGGTAIVTSLAGAQGVGGDTADGAADAGKSLKVGGKVVLNSAALPAALTAGQRAPAMSDEYGRLRVVPNRTRVLGEYKFESGVLSVLAAAHASTVGFFWLINPVGSTVLVVVKKVIFTGWPSAATAFASSPRVTVERMTFTGVASGAQVTPALRDSTDAAPVASIRTASTGLTPVAGAVCGDFSVPAVLTAVGIHVPVDQWLYDSTDEDDYIRLRAGEGLVFRQADAGTTSDTRKCAIFGAWEER